MTSRWRGNDAAGEPTDLKSPDVIGVGRATAPGVVLVAVLALVVGCSTTVTGSGSTTGSATEAVTTTTGAESTPAPLPTIDEAAPARYCDDPFPGVLGKPMPAVVVETPSGRPTCDRAGAVLFDYYTRRRDPKSGIDFSFDARDKVDLHGTERR